AGSIRRWRAARPGFRADGCQGSGLLAIAIVPQGGTMNLDSGSSRIPEEFAARLAGHVDTVVHLYCRLLPDHDQKNLAQDALTALVERWRDESRRPAE